VEQGLIHHLQDGGRSGSETPDGQGSQAVDGKWIPSAATMKAMPAARSRPLHFIEALSFFEISVVLSAAIMTYFFSNFVLRVRHEYLYNLSTIKRGKNMDEKTFITALSGTLLGLIPIIVTAFLNRLDKFGRNSMNDRTVDFAKRHVEFLEAWLKACLQSVTPKNAARIKGEVAEELEAIHKFVNNNLEFRDRENVKKARRNWVFFHLVPPLILVRIIGLLGVMLPLALIAGTLIQGAEIQASLDYFYYSPMRFVLIIGLFAIGICLVFYKGYGPIDSFASKICGITAMVMAVFPSDLNASASGASTPSGIIHSICYGIFILVLSFTSIFIFTLSSVTQTARSTYKQKRNVVYRICGIVMLTCMAVYTAITLLPVNVLMALRHVRFGLILDTVSFFAFGFSWITKSRLIFPDKSPTYWLAGESGNEPGMRLS
jgi:hypothetical protein